MSTGVKGKLGESTESRNNREDKRMRERQRESQEETREKKREINLFI